MSSKKRVKKAAKASDSKPAKAQGESSGRVSRGVNPSSQPLIRVDGYGASGSGVNGVSMARESGHRALPTMFKSGKDDGSVVVSGVEYLSTLSVGSTPAVSGTNLALLSLALDKATPGVIPSYQSLGDLLSGAGTRLAYLSRAWSKFRTRRLALRYQPIASALTTAGVVAAFCADPEDHAQLTAADVGTLMSQGCSQGSQAFQPFRLEIPVNREATYYIEGPDSGVPQAYSRLASAGLIRVATQGPVAANTALGFLLLEYEMELVVPAYLTDPVVPPGYESLEVALPVTTSSITTLSLDPTAGSLDVISTTPAWFDTATGAFLEAGVYQLTFGLQYAANYAVCINSDGSQTFTRDLPVGWTAVPGSGTYDSTGSVGQSKGTTGMATFVRAVGDKVPGFFTYNASAGGPTTTQAIRGSCYQIVRIAEASAAQLARNLQYADGPDLVRDWCVRFPAHKACGDWMYSCRGGAYTTLPWTALEEALYSDLMSGVATAQSLEPQEEEVARPVAPPRTKTTPK